MSTANQIRTSARLCLWASCVTLLGLGPIATARAQSTSPAEADDTGSESAALPGDPVRLVGGSLRHPSYLSEQDRFSVGGYAAFQFEMADDEEEGRTTTFVPSRVALFADSRLARNVRFAAELAVQGDTSAVPLGPNGAGISGQEETEFSFHLDMAVADVRIVDQAILRAGVLKAPLGRFNLLHYDPLRSFGSAPLAFSEIVPAPLSSVGAGVYGTVAPAWDMQVSYEAYLVNGFDDGVVIGDPQGVRIPEGTRNFEDADGKPAFTGRVAVSPHPIAEVGTSIHTGTYDGDAMLTLIGVDAMVRWDRFEGTAEYVRADVDIPDSYAGLAGFSDHQSGLYAQGSVRFLEGVVPALPESVFAATVRYDRLSLDPDGPEGDPIERLGMGVSMRPIRPMAIRLEHLRTVGEEVPPLWVASAASYF